MDAIIALFTTQISDSLSLHHSNHCLKPDAQNSLTVNKSAQLRKLHAAIPGLNTLNESLMRSLELRCHTACYNVILRKLGLQNGGQKSIQNLKLQLHVYDYNLPGIQAGVCMTRKILLVPKIPL
jgi:hypothetical protein